MAFYNDAGNQVLGSSSGDGAFLRFNIDATGAITYDASNRETQIARVVPAPEPGGLALWVIGVAGILGLGAGRLRRSKSWGRLSADRGLPARQPESGLRSPRTNVPFLAAACRSNHENARKRIHMLKTHTKFPFLLLAALLSIAALALPAAPIDAAPALATAAQANDASNTDGLFGMNGIGFFHYRDAPDAETTAQKKMDFLKKAEVTWDRFDFWWSEMEPTKGDWKWDKADWLIDFYAKNGMNMLPILSYRAAWMKEPPYTPEDDAEFADYTSHVVSRYKDRIHAWEVWNEPNIPTFWKPPSAVDYTNMLKAAYKAARTADPKCVIVGAAANETDVNWIIDIAKLGGLDYMDAVSIHPYSMSDGPEQMDLTRQIENVRTVLAAYGHPNMPIWITEMGWKSSITDAKANSRNSGYMAQSYVIAASQHVPHLFWFSEQDWNEGGKLQGWGLLSPDGQPKPTLATYRHLSDTLGHSRFLGYLPLKNGKAYVFQHAGSVDPTVFAWANRGQTAIVPISVKTEAQATDNSAVELKNGQLTVTDMPVTIRNPSKTLLAKLTKTQPASESSNLVVNGDMSEVNAKRDPYGWHEGLFYGGTDKGAFAVSIAPDGSHSLTLSATDDALWQSWPVPAIPGERYTLTAQMKTTNATGTNSVQILYLAGPGWGWKGGPSSKAITGTTDWQTATVTGVVPSDADFVRVNLVSKGNTGSVQFRHVVLKRG